MLENNFQIHELPSFLITPNGMAYFSYDPASNRCKLCLWEKYFIIYKPELASLYKRRHAGKFLL